MLRKVLLFIPKLSLKSATEEASNNTWSINSNSSKYYDIHNIHRSHRHTLNCTYNVPQNSLSYLYIFFNEEIYFWLQLANTFCQLQEAIFLYCFITTKAVAMKYNFYWPQHTVYSPSCSILIFWSVWGTTLLFAAEEHFPSG